jgi:hypothetical protein
MLATIPVHHILLNLILLILSGDEYKLWGTSRKFFQPPVNSSLLGQNIFLNSLFITPFQIIYRSQRPNVILSNKLFTVSCYPHAQPLSWRTSPCRLSVTAYSIYSQLPSISGGRFIHPQPQDAPCRGDEWPI